MGLLVSDKNSIPNSGARKMVDVVQRLPVGWSLIETNEGWVVRDQDDDFICKAETTDHLHRILNTEFELAQMFASMMFVLKTSKPAEA